MKGPPSNPNCPVISVEMTDEDVIKRVANFFETSIYKPKKRGVYKQTYVARVRGEKAVQIMNQLLPLMGDRRKEQIKNSLASYVLTRLKIDEKTVAQMLKLAKLGFTHKKIASELGLCRESVTRHLNNHGDYSVVVSITDCESVGARFKSG